jgi:hypothetical protein
MGTVVTLIKNQEPASDLKLLSVVFSKICFGNPNAKFLEVPGMSKFGIYVMMKYGTHSLQF